MAVTLADIAQIDAATYELPKDYTPRDVEILYWLFCKERWSKDDLKAAEFEIKILQEQIKKLKSKKVTELAKPLKKRMNFQELMEMLLKIHIDEIETFQLSDDESPNLEVRTDKAQNLAKHLAQMIILLTTYLQFLGIDETGRQYLFEDVQAEEWFNG